jgi:hypothetical protein
MKLGRNKYWTLALGFGAASLLGGALLWSRFPATGEPPSQNQNEHYESSPYGSSEQHEIAKPFRESWALIWERTWDDPVAFYTLVLAVFTVVVGVATVITTIIGIYQIRQSRREFIATHRPIIRVRRFVIPKLENGKPIKIEFEAANVGNSSAYNVVAHLEITIPKERSDVMYEKPPHPHKGTSINMLDHPIAGGGVHYFVELTSLIHVALGNRYDVRGMVISGRLTYSDRFQESFRTTGFLRVYPDVRGPHPRPPFRFVKASDADEGDEYED